MRRRATRRAGSIDGSNAGADHISHRPETVGKIPARWIAADVEFMGEAETSCHVRAEAVVRPENMSSNPN
nr:hypothetical protein Hi04_10k_c5216_00005 [uncultured bacterium]